MKTINFKEKIQLYLKANPNISSEEIGVLLWIDAIYKVMPGDLDEFKKLYAHLDPNIINDENNEEITFLKIVRENKSEKELKDKLNSYINIKYSNATNKFSYEENMLKFKEHSLIISDFIEYILKTAKFPKEILEVLKESKEVKNCSDCYEMLCIYKKTKSKKVKFEILRKIGLIVLLSRVQKSFIMSDYEYVLDEVKKVFVEGLGLKEDGKEKLYLWLNRDDKVSFAKDKNKAEDLYGIETRKRMDLALYQYDMQVFEHTLFKTNKGSKIYHFEYRNKFKKNGKVSYDSFLEKMIRKNIEFPNQINDVLGVKLVLENEKETLRHIGLLENFLGGSSTRKQEKNTLHMFGKKSLSEYSAKEYFVWKAIYDITIPHNSIREVEKMLSITKENKIAQKKLKKRLQYFKDRPRDYVVEVQLQDIYSYLLSITKGSLTDHNILKMNQIRLNSFFKFFPKEIYEEELFRLKDKILGNKKN